MPHVTLTGVAYKDGNQFTALCPELGVASCGDTAEEALEMLEEALEVYLESVHEVGELAREFDEMGIEVHPDSPKSDEAAQRSKVRNYSMKVPELVVV